MIEKLTPEQEAKLDVYREEYLAKFYDKDPNDINEEKIKEWFKWLYNLAGLKEPEVYIVDSPRQALIKANELCGTKKKYYDFCTYGSSWDLGWLSFYKFFQEECNIEYEVKDLFNKFHEIVDLGVFDSIQLSEACIVSKLSSKISKRGDLLHREDGPAIEFNDGYALYFWMGVNVSEKLIMRPDEITQKDILEEDNAEVRRAMRERLGGVRYYELIGGGEALTVIDEDTDDQGYPMTLFETRIKDEVIDKKVQFIQVTCPSTERVYDIYPPNQESKNVWEAKASTFNAEKLKYRHGDVGLKKVGEEPEKPTQET